MEKNNKIIEVIVKLLQNNTDSFFDLLIELTSPITYFTIKKFYLTHFEQNDFLQEAWTVLYISVGTYDESYGNSFVEFYSRELYNHMNKLVRENHAYKRLINLESISLDKLAEEKGINVQGKSPSTTEPENMALVNETFQSYIVELSVFEEKVLDLFVSGNNVEEIAKELSSSIKQVQGGLYRARKKLEKLING